MKKSWISFSALVVLLVSTPVLDAQTPAPDLYSLELIAAPELQRFTAHADLRPVPSPFSVPVTQDGVSRYDVFITADSLPDPRSLGAYSTFVVWAAPPSLSPIVKLGELKRGSHRGTAVGEVAFNRFTLFVSAEASSAVAEPRGPFVLRGLSPSMRLGIAHVVQARAPASEHAAHTDTSGWEMPPAHPRASAMYMPALHGMTPHATPFLPDSSAKLPLVKPRTFMQLKSGDSLRLEAAPVRRIMRGRSVVMYGFNGQQPGPLLVVQNDARIVVNFVNRTAHETAVHWHGVRLDNRFDGVPHVTQHPVAPGDSFRYEIKFPDAGIYWYHPHHREDIQQDLGLYGNMFVRGNQKEYGAANAEEFLMLDDLLLGDDGLIAYGRERATHALMGRFGNVLLVNGEPAPRVRAAKRGEVVRLFLTNVANTRTFNLSMPGARIKIVGSDVGRFEHEEWTETVVLAPAERYIVEVLLERPGRLALLNSVQSIDHTRGTFFPETDTLAIFDVSNERAQPDHSESFAMLRRHDDVVRDVARYRSHFERAPDRTITLTMKDTGLPYPVVQLLQRDTLFFNPVEWSGTMPMMDWLPTADQVRWVLRDQASGLENDDITWKFKSGDLVRIRFVNDRHTLHAMAHPIHIHGQRFLVLSVNGRPTTNHVWKDTVLVPVGSVVEILLEVTNPGMWMMHCHIAEHLEAGMKTVFGVTN